MACVRRNFDGFDKAIMPSLILPVQHENEQKNPPKHARFLLLSAIMASVSVGGMCDTTPIEQLYGIAALAGAGGNPIQGDDGEMDQPPPRETPEENLDGDPEGAVHGFFSKPPDENGQSEDMYGDGDMYGVGNGR